MPRRGRRVAVILALSILAPIAARSLQAHRLQPAAQDRPPSPLTLDLVALDRDGHFVDSLRPDDLAVTVNGDPRRVLSMRHVSRGPGAFASAALEAASGGPVDAAAENSRTVLIVIDEVMLDPISVRTVREAAGAFIDRLGPNDRVAVVRIPQPGTSLTFTTDRPALREALRGVGVDEPTPADPTPAPGLIPAGDLERMSMTLYGLEELFGRLGEISGRKVVALFSAGLPAHWLQLASEVDAPEKEKLAIRSVTQRAAASRVAVYGIGVRQSPPKARPRPDLAPVETIARETGGQFSTVDVLDKSLGRLVSALSACYVLELENGPESPGGQPSKVDVKTFRKDVTLESAAWIVAGNPPDDRPVPALLPEANDAALAPSDPDLRLILPRLSDYADAYQRRFSAFVAEEDYQQWVSSRQGRHLRSDLLLLAPEAGGDWVQFRDVFEVDGRKVRDREDRLKKLFLENSAAGQRQLKAIQDESARYNIGDIVRDQNVPLYALTFATSENISRLTFMVAKKQVVNGLVTWRVEYKERVRPTFIRNLKKEDVPVHGAFTVDYATGTVLETEMIADGPDVRGWVVVRYRRDAAQGLWLPKEMLENYGNSKMPVSGAPEMAPPGVWISARATYSTFRRFRVTTEEHVREKRQAALHGTAGPQHRGAWGPRAPRTRRPRRAVALPMGMAPSPRFAPTAPAARASGRAAMLTHAMSRSSDTEPKRIQSDFLTPPVATSLRDSRRGLMTASVFGYSRPSMAWTVSRSARARASDTPGFSRPMALNHVDSRLCAYGASIALGVHRSVPRTGNAKPGGMTPTIA